MPETFTPVEVPVASLRPHPRNYRRHPPDQIAHIRRSIELHGYYRNVVVARDGTILAGHGVVEAVRDMNRDTVPVIRLDLDPMDSRALTVLTGDNEISRLADVDDRALTELLRELAEESVETLLGTGFDEGRVAALAMVTRPRSELEDFSAAAEWVGLPAFDPSPPPVQVTVKFDTPAERDDFLARNGMVHVHYRTPEMWTAWWPDRERADLNSVRYQ